MKMALSFAVAVVASMLSASHAAKLTLSSPTVANGRTLPDVHVYNDDGCTGANRSPELSWSGAPAGTKSFAVTVHDPDAPHEGGWWHWLVFDISAGARGLPEGAGNGAGLPAGAIESRTDFGKPGYGGACPPPGNPHRYVFAVYALKTAKLGLKSDDAPAKVDGAIRHNSLGQATITALYGQ
ncbi:MAG: YbhB/YbcL family Raf kinase inhibitor-like protein [Rhizomicrobium sp.]|jgi:Raf kinase inhibitor-like YbhB/YbcL family protein